MTEWRNIYTAPVFIYNSKRLAAVKIDAQMKALSADALAGECRILNLRPMVSKGLLLPYLLR